jgi:hypothetical protein
MAPSRRVEAVRLYEFVVPPTIFSQVPAGT